ncbi:hypothetical protein JCM9279_001840 [Rhodotorula babjevae]
MPLRMKATAYDEAVLRAQKRAARKSKHRSRPRSESLTPPRNPPKDQKGMHKDDIDTPYFGQGTDDDYHPPGDDPDAHLPPPQAHKRTRTDDEFLEALADAEQADSGIGAFEDDFYARQVPAYATTYGSAAGAAAGIAPAASYLSHMDEDEYAEFVRAGMWRRKNRDEVERLERLDKERRAKEERERKDKDKRDREERERIRRLEERKKRKSKEEEVDARRRYDEGWKKLQQAVAAAAAAPPPPPPTPSMPVAPDAPTVDVDSAATVEAAAPPDPPSSSSTSTSFPLRFTDFPWPLYPPMAFPPLSWPSLSDLTSSSISAFLLPDSLASSEHKQTLRQATLAYHPDRFERYVLRVPEDKEDVRERLRELGLRVSQVLNDLAKRGS